MLLFCILNKKNSFLFAQLHTAVPANGKRQPEGRLSVRGTPTSTASPAWDTPTDVECADPAPSALALDLACDTSAEWAAEAYTTALPASGDVNSFIDYEEVITALVRHHGGQLTSSVRHDAWWAMPLDQLPLRHWCSGRLRTVSKIMQFCAQVCGPQQNHTQHLFSDDELVKLSFRLSHFS